MWDGSPDNIFVRSSDDTMDLTIVGGDDFLTTGNPAMVVVYVKP